MKYKIKIFGKGADCFLFKLTEEQYEYLSDNGVQEGSMDIIEIQDYLEIGDIGESELTITGPYTEESCLGLIVEDEQSNEVFNSYNNREKIEEILENSKWLGTDYDEGFFLAIEDHVKGKFFSTEIEIDEPFDINKLSLSITDLAEVRDIVSSVSYNGKELELEFGDYSSRGFSFILN
jgi:hypothetical protein